MRKVRIDNEIEEQIITGMIVSSEFLNGLIPIYNSQLLSIPYSRTVARWCVKYHEQYRKAPGKHIQDIYNSHARGGDLPEEQQELISAFLEKLSSVYETTGVNVQYLLDQAELRFKARSLTMLSEDIDTLLLDSRVQDAEHLLLDYKRVERVQARGIDVLTDAERIREAVDGTERNILFTMPGALGEMMGPIERSSLTSFMGREKIGKTFTLLEVAFRAVRAGCNVAFFEVGDLDEDQTIVRVQTYVSKQSPRFFGKVRTPVLDCWWNQTDVCEKGARTCDFGVQERKGGENGDWVKSTLEQEPDYTPCTHCRKEEPKSFQGAVWYTERTVERLDWKTAVRNSRKFAKQSQGQFKLAVYPNDTINVRGIEQHLDMWEQEQGFMPDVIVIDYADILASEDPRIEHRHQIDKTWKSMKRLSQERHCAVITATQSDSAGYNKRSLTMANFSDDKRKYSHVNAMFAINQTTTEKEDSVVRIGPLVVREMDFISSNEVTVLQCLKLGRPYLGSYHVKRLGGNAKWKD